jgi:predicted ATP-dependent protease
LEREGRDVLHRLEIETAGSVIDAPLERLRQEYADHPKVIAFLEASKEDMLTRVADLRAAGAEEGGRQALLPLPRPEPFARYQVTLLVDNSATRGAPVVVEPNPTYYNLVGKAEYRAEFGTLVTDPSMVKAGALHRANGGYLILQIHDVLTSPFAYEGLKRALRSREIKIEPLGESLGMIAVSTLRPEPIPLDVKVILVGTPDLYYLLYALDEEFEKLFKIRADFDVVMDLSELSGLPIDQGIAVTGSVNQRGEIQPIGGANDKIEGFYSACKIKGLTGRQGVVIPHQNVRDLMLRDEVVSAVREGRFHVRAVRTIDEEIELLTGVAAGAPEAAGAYPADSVNGRVAARLAEFARRYREFGVTDGQRAQERQIEELSAGQAAEPRLEIRP